VKQLSFKVRVFIIFLVPAIAILYLTYYFVNIKYNELQNASSHKLFSEMTKVTSNLTHSIQIERGLSVGYIIVKKKGSHKNRLLQQQKTTDKAYQNFMHYYNLQKNDTNTINQLVLFRNESKIKKILQKIHYLQQIRSSIIKRSINLTKIIHYYSSINDELIQIVYTLTTSIAKNDTDPNGIYRLEELKENAGLERAYIYNQLLSNKLSNTKLLETRSLINKEEEMQKEFLSNASVIYLKLYNNIVDEKLQIKLKNQRELFFKGALNSKDASNWFQISTDRINNLEKLSIAILNSYTQTMDNIVYKSKRFMLITLILWLLSIIAFLLLIYILNRLIDKEAKLIEDLRISSYAFDAYEAMTVTDPNGTIIKVNKAFSNITGYTADEVIGKNPRVLKSYKHSDEFYKNMWLELHTNGRWSSEIYNKRKNGEIYMEKLSITAIKDKNDITTHYIAQFLDISDIQKAQKIIQYQASHDFLTGANNRKSLMEKLQEEFARAKRHNFFDAFLFIDLDGFKTINDSYGHKIGDRVLINVCRRLKSCIREEDYIARIGGDEFCVVLVNVDKNYEVAKNNTKKFTEKILLSLSEPFDTEQHNIQISASIGIKLFPDEVKDINDIINQADIAMYQAKEQGKNRSVFSSL
jgi:diguanylate cyclase (GGDEF)-like protein/PAS domain S-box-containing protein